MIRLCLFVFAALAAVTACGASATAQDRNAFLVTMTDDVAAHVLRDNYDQTLALSVAEMRSARDFDVRRHERLPSPRPAVGPPQMLGNESSGPPVLASANS